MSVVIDANLIVVLATANPRRVAVSERLAGWRADGEDLHAPNLFSYEIASAVAGLESSGQLSRVLERNFWALIETLDLTLHQPSSAAALVAITRKLQRCSAYDAAYIDLALTLNTELWTLDGKLAKNAESVGFPVRFVV